MQIPPEMGGMPPHWGTYFTVNDVDQTARDALEIWRELDDLAQGGDGQDGAQELIAYEAAAATRSTPAEARLLDVVADAVVVVAGGHQRGWIDRAGAHVVQWRVGVEGAELLGIVGAAGAGEEGGQAAQPPEKQGCGDPGAAGARASCAAASG